jgi:hypothetical protein
MKHTIALTALLSLLTDIGSSRADIVYFEVPLSGAQESPGPGDPDGTGLAKLWFDSAANSVTWDITVADIAPFTLDHIHRGAAGAAGPVRIDFASQLSGGPLVDPDVALLLADPTQYYVNVHTADFPAGAVRGQLGEPKSVPDSIGFLSSLVAFLSIAAARRKSFVHA